MNSTDNFVIDAMTDIVAVTATIFLEARGESIEGRIAVGHVIMNRSVRRSQSIKEVVFAAKQFSCFNDFDSEKVLAKLCSLPEVYMNCREIAQCVLHGSFRTGGFPADHYYNPALCQPSWADGMKIVATIGNHVFLDSKQRREENGENH